MAIFKQPFLENLSVTHKALIVLVCAATYFASFTLNDVLFSDLLFTHRVHWIYLPSGVRLLAVLVFFELGAVGILFGSLIINYLHFFDGNHLVTLVTCLLSAGVPLLARYLSVEWFKLNINLEGLTPTIILKMTVLFAVLSSVTLQLWFYWIGRTEDFITATAVMAIGKFFGTTLVLATASLVLKHIKRPLQKG